MFDQISIEVRALHQLGDASLAQVDRRHVLERRAGARERSPHSGDDRDTPSRGAKWRHEVKLTGFGADGLGAKATA
jgi:hypothetical protein